MSLRTLLSSITDTRCRRGDEHEAHGRCLGIRDEDCGLQGWHADHRVAPGLRCRGRGLAGVCRHGIGMLDYCTICAG